MEIKGQLWDAETQAAGITPWRGNRRAWPGAWIKGLARQCRPGAAQDRIRGGMAKHFGGLPRKRSYFPMQKRPKISPSKSSAL